MSQAGTLAYRYAAPSALSRDGVLSLATSGGVTEMGPAAHPYFFAGFLADPGPVAQALLACAAIARARYHVASSTLAASLDPVVTCNTDRLRFESFSGCCGVHARLDLPPDALEAAPVTSGTTNVDFNPPMRAALAGAVATAGQLLLKVGDAEVTAVTQAAAVTERKVKLPARWVKGFGEVSALHARMRLVADISGPDVQRFLSALPRAARNPLWVVPAGRTLSLAASPRPGAACLTGPERLAELRPLLRFTKQLRVYAPADPPNAPAPNGLPAPSAWELTLGKARFTLTISPEKYRGFTGEGGLLGALATDTAEQDADLIGLLLGWGPVISLPGLSSSSGLSPERTMAALATLASSGRVGYDLADGAYFHRELPLGAEVAKLVPGRSAASTAARAVARLSGTFGPIGHLALVAGLASAEADTRIAAADAWVQLAREGRLDAGLAAEAITLGVKGTAFKLTRIADGLRYAVQDPGAAGTVAAARVSAAAVLLSAPDKPVALHLLLETAARAGAVSAVPQLPSAVAGLARGKDRTKLAEAARRLAALT